MATLKEEMEAVCVFPRTLSAPGDRWTAGFDAALREYGDYEIVDGELKCVIKGRFDVLVGKRFIGTECDHVKLLVPPREKKAPQCNEMAELRCALICIRDMAAARRTCPPNIWEDIWGVAHRALLEEKEDDSR